MYVENLGVYYYLITRISQNFYYNLSRCWLNIQSWKLEFHCRTRGIGTVYLVDVRVAHFLSQCVRRDRHLKKKMDFVQEFH